MGKALEQAVQSLLTLLSPLYPAKASVEPPPPDKPEEGRAEIVALLRAIVMNGNETTKYVRTAQGEGLAPPSHPSLPSHTFHPHGCLLLAD